MAAIDTRQTVNGPRYDVPFGDRAGHQRKKALRTKKEAERFAASVEAVRLSVRARVRDIGRGCVGDARADA